MGVRSQKKTGTSGLVSSVAGRRSIDLQQEPWKRLYDGGLWMYDCRNMGFV